MCRHVWSMMFFTLYYKALVIIQSNWSKHRNLWLGRLVVWFYIVVQMKPTLITCNKLRLIVYALKWHVFDQSAKHAVSSKVNLSLLNTNTYVLSKQWQYLNYIRKWAYYFLNVTPNVFMCSIYPTNLTPSFYQFQFPHHSVECILIAWQHRFTIYSLNI